MTTREDRRAVRIGVMGGSFDPIHLGHLVAASEAAHALRLDQVVFCPTGQAWHKPDDGRAPADLRVLMTTLATQSDPRFRVSRVDVDRPGPTYTVDTLADLRAEALAGGLDPEFWFITGADALAEFGTWREPDRILAAAHLVGVTRPGHRLAGDELPADRVTLLEIPALAISSSEIRDRVRRGAPIAYLVPDAVSQVIEKHGLYRDAP